MIRRLSIVAMFCGLLLAIGTSTLAEKPSSDAGADADADNPDHSIPVREIAIVGAIGPATSAYVADEIDTAAAADAPLIILRLDTPGGLDGAMRDIVQAVLASPVPVAAYVAPSGARAASAGTYILYASHIAAMAPATNLGAATPVSLGGGTMPGDSSPPAADDQTNDKQNDGQSGDQNGGKDDNDSEKTSDNVTAKRRKVVNDAVAYIRSLAEKRGRNADWAERAVREGVSLSAEQALADNVVEHVVDDEQALLAAIDGNTVNTDAGEQTLETAGLSIQKSEPDWRIQLLSVITQPTVAYLLFMIGIYGLILEGLNPGATVPGVIGGISLLCALFAFQVLPVNYAGLALIALGVGLIVAEAFAPSFGILGLGGLAAFVFGSVLLMDTNVPGFEVPLGAIGALAVAGGLLLLLIVFMFARSRQHRVHTGHEGLVGSRCVALEDFQREGRVWLHGESWLAESNTPVRRDQSLTVTHTEGLKVFVQARDNTRDAPSHPAGRPTAGS